MPNKNVKLTHIFLPVFYHCVRSTTFAELEKGGKIYNQRKDKEGREKPTWWLWGRRITRIQQGISKGRAHQLYQRKASKWCSSGIYSVDPLNVCIW
jgi:hypothetical protein